MSTLTQTFSEAGFPNKPDYSFLIWFLLVLFMEITDTKRIEKKRKKPVIPRPKPIKMVL